MSGAKFTPGPWTADTHHTKRDGGQLYGFVHSHSLVPICGVPLSVDGYGYDEGAANAHLIAAAPTMFAALEALNECARPINWEDEDLEPGETDAWRRLDAALALTRGESNRD